MVLDELNAMICEWWSLWNDYEIGRLMKWWIGSEVSQVKKSCKNCFTLIHPPSQCLHLQSLSSFHGWIGSHIRRTIDGVWGSGFGFSTKRLTAYLVWMNFSFAERLSLSSDLLIGLLYISSSSVTRLPQAPSSLEFFPDSRNSSHTELA